MKNYTLFFQCYIHDNVIMAKNIVFMSLLNGLCCNKENFLFCFFLGFFLFVCLFVCLLYNYFYYAMIKIKNFLLILLLCLPQHDQKVKKSFSLFQHYVRCPTVAGKRILIFIVPLPITWLSYNHEKIFLFFILLRHSLRKYLLMSTYYTHGVTNLSRKSPSQKNMHNWKNFFAQEFQCSLTWFTSRQSGS